MALNRAAGVLLKVAVFATSLFLCLFLAEVVSRVLFPGWAPVSAERLLWRHHPGLGWFHVPNCESRFRHRDFDISVRTNELGLRDGPVVRRASPGAIRCLVLGDSFAWGYGVEEDERFSERIEALQPALQMINAGVSGYGTDQQLLLYRMLGPRLKPDLVLVLLHGNDFTNNVSRVQYWHAKPLFGLRDGCLVQVVDSVRAPGLKQRLGKFILGRTYLYAHLYRRLWKPIEAALSGRRHRARDRNGDGPRPRPVTGRGDDGEDAYDQRLTAELLKHLGREVSAHGGRLVVVSVPMDGAEHLARFLARELAEAGIPYLPLDAAMHGHSADEIYFPHDRHWTPAGHRIAAQATAAFLRERGLLNGGDKGKADSMVKEP